MKKIMLVSAILATAFISAGCERIATGEIGLREDFNKTIEPIGLQPGSLNQTLVGAVHVFPVKQIGLNIEQLHPQTADHSTLAEMDFIVVYNLNPAAIYDLYTTKAHSFNAIDNHGDTLIMYNYLMNIANSAAFKAVNKHNALDVASNRDAIEHDIAQFMRDALKSEGLDNSILIDQVQVKNILPAQSIIESANLVITAQNNQNAKTVEVGTARLEAQRLSLLSSNHQNIEYMKAKALEDIGAGIRAGTVNTIVVPYDFRGIVNANPIK